MKAKSFSRVRLFATPWTAAYQSPPSTGCSRQEYWSGVPLPSPSTEEQIKERWWREEKDPTSVAIVIKDLSMSIIYIWCNKVHLQVSVYLLRQPTSHYSPTHPPTHVTTDICTLVSVYLATYLPHNLLIHPSLFIYLSIIYLYICLPIHPSILYLSPFPSIHPFILYLTSYHHHHHQSMTSMPFHLSILCHLLPFMFLT